MNLENAAADIRYLLDRGYPSGSAVGFVCDHYRLDGEARHLLSRAILPHQVSERRKARFLPCGEMNGSSIVIDGYNIIIGMESILENQAYLCDDGVIRDIKGVFRNYRASHNTDEAINTILQFLRKHSPEHVCFLLDSQISKSGQLAGNLRERIGHYGLKGDAKTSKHVDHDLKTSKDIVASSDGVIIDAAEKVVNFLDCLVSGFRHLEAGVNRKLSDIKIEAFNDDKK